MMKKINLIVVIALLTLAAVIGSCKTEFISPTFKPASDAAISKLPESEKLNGKEIMDWYATNLQLTGLQPGWDKPKQTIFHKHHVIFVFVGPDAGLFFTKINGILNVDAYRWQDKNPGTKFFTGNVIDYSFQSNKLHGMVYSNSMLIRKGTMQLKTVPPVEFIGKFFVSDVWSWIESYAKEKAHH